MAEVETLWSILDASSNKSRGNPKFRTPQQLVVLGDVGSGKSSIVAKLQGHKFQSDEIYSGTGIEYTYVDVRDDEESEDALTRLNVWTLDGLLDDNDQSMHNEVLETVITKENLECTTAMVVIDMSKPWGIMDSLNRWTRVLEELVQKLSPDGLDDMKKNLAKAWQTFDQDGKGSPKDAVLIPLESDVFTHQLGIPLIIVLSKCDASIMLAKDLDYTDEKFDFVQRAIRRFCLTWGASLVSTDVGHKNQKVLYEYVMHRVYDLPLKSKASVDELDALFVPSGWDTSNKIRFLDETIQSVNPEDIGYEDLITKPKNTGTREHKIKARDEQDFLKEQMKMLDSTTAASGSFPTSIAEPIPPTKITSTDAESQAVSTTTTNAVTPTVTPGSGGSGQQNEEQLRNFFNNLLDRPKNKKKKKSGDGQ